MLKTQAIIGTVSYMAPEQLRGKPVQASDQYALGVMVYEWLCGHCPFEGAPAVVYNLQLNESPPSLRAILPTLPLQLEQVVMKALARYPEQRFVNVQAFADALEDVSKYVQDLPLFLAHDANSQGPSGITQLSTLPPTIVAPPPVVNLPDTVIVGSPLSQPLLSRRALLRSIAGLTVVGGGGGIAWLLLEEGKQQSRAKKTQPTSSPTVKPSPTATPVPTKKDAIYTYTGHQAQVHTVAWAPNDQYITSAGGNVNQSNKGDTRVHVWNPMTHQVANIYTNHSDVVRMVAWSPLDDQRIASASEDHTVQIWDATSGNNALIYTGHTKEVMAVSWNQDGTRIASGSRDTTVQIWDAAAVGKSLFTFTKHTTDVNAVAWSPWSLRLEASLWASRHL